MGLRRCELIRGRHVYVYARPPSISLSFSDPVSCRSHVVRCFPRGSADTEHENGRTPVKTSTWWGCHGNIQYVLQVGRLLKTSSLGQSASLSTLRPRPYATRTRNLAGSARSRARPGTRGLLRPRQRVHAR
jgi:hypothetical protein